MNREEATALLGVESGADREAIQVRFQELFSEYRIRLTNAPTPALKTTYQRKIAEIGEAFEVLTGEPATLDQDLPLASPSIGQSANTEPPRDHTVSRSSKSSPPRQRSAEAPGWKSPLLLVIPVGVVLLLAGVRLAIVGGESRDEEPASGPTGPQGTLLVRSGTWGAVLVDGNRVGRVDASGLLRVPLAIGDHLVEVVSSDGLDRWDTVATVRRDAQTIIEAGLAVVTQRRLDEEERLAAARRDSADRAERNRQARAAQARRDSLWLIVDYGNSNESNEPFDCLFGGWPSKLVGGECGHPLRRHPGYGDVVTRSGNSPDRAGDDTQLVCNPVFFGDNLWVSVRTQAERNNVFFECVSRFRQDLDSGRRTEEDVLDAMSSHLDELLYSFHVADMVCSGNIGNQADSHQCRLASMRLKEVNDYISTGQVSYASISGPP